MPENDEARDRWPRFDLVSFRTPTGIPHGWDAELLRKGVPKALIGQSYQAASELMLLNVPGNGHLVCFGISGLLGKACLDPHTGAIITITDVPPEYSHTLNLVSGIYGPSCFINSSLDQFIASVRVVLDRFPFDSGDTEERDDRDQPASIKANGDELADEWDKAADELTEALRGIDSAAVADLDGFWMTFVADVQMGNYATKVVLTAPEE